MFVGYKHSIFSVLHSRKTKMRNQHILFSWLGNRGWTGVWEEGRNVSLAAELRYSCTPFMF